MPNTCDVCSRPATDAPDKDGKLICVKCQDKKRQARGHNKKEYSCNRCEATFPVDNVRKIPGETPEGVVYCLTCLDVRLDEIKKEKAAGQARSREKAEGDKAEKDRQDKEKAENDKEDAENERQAAEEAETERLALEEARARQAVEAARQAQKMLALPATSGGLDATSLECQGCDEWKSRDLFPRRVGARKICKKCILDFLQYEKEQAETATNASTQIGTIYIPRERDKRRSVGRESVLSRRSAERKKGERELLEIMRREKAAELYQKCKAEEEELLRCLEETRRKRELAANLARPSLVQKDQPLSVPRGSTDDRRSLDGISLSDSERNASIRGWPDASGVNNQKEATSTARIGSHNHTDAYASGVRWEDLDAMEKSVIEARPTSNARPIASLYDTTSQPVPASAPLAARTSGGFMRDLNQTVTNETELAIANVRQLRPEQLVARRYLPKELPTFAGDPSDWPKFISAYVESQAHCNYSRRENMMRLKPALKGDALKLVEDLLNFPDNLDRVINSLTYGHPDKIRNAIVGKLRSLPPVGTDDLEGITRLANKVLGYSSTLQSAQQHGDRYNPDYVPELESKLPAHIRLSLGMHKRTSGSSLSAFAEWLFEVGEAAGSLGEPYRPKPVVPKRPLRVHTHSVPPKPAPEDRSQHQKLLQEVHRHDDGWDKMIQPSNSKGWMWWMEAIKELPVTDGQVQTIEIKTAMGYYRRPASKIARFDTTGDPEETPHDHVGGNVNSSGVQNSIEETLNTGFIEEDEPLTSPTVGKPSGYSSPATQ